jgi:predicted acylesterase/phospholipase RssA
MILASAAIPLLFNPVRIGSMQLWDGGILVNSPLAPAVALGARRIVPVLVTSRTPPAEVMLDTFGEGMERVVDTFLENAYTNDRKLLLDRNALADRLEDDDLVRVELFRAIRPRSGSTFNAGSYLYFEREALLSMHEAGVKAARDWLDRGPELDSRWTPD